MDEISVVSKIWQFCRNLANMASFILVLWTLRAFKVSKPRYRLKSDPLLVYFLRCSKTYQVARSVCVWGSS